MTSFLPISLSGATLNERHRELNERIREAVKQNVAFDKIQNSEEKSPLDGLFKVEYAVATRHLPYILKTLRNQDLFLVSKALCSLLLDKDHADIINPKYLEQSLFPEMTTTAVNKMKHWIALNLRDASRCEQFYEYYAKKEYNLATKFLWKCEDDFILNEVPKILSKLTPHQLKMLGEKCPKVIKMYFDSFEKDDKLLKTYLDAHEEYFNVLKYILKLDANTVLDIYEKYFENNIYGKFSSETTRYIMIKHKERFNNKPELYTAWFLDMNTVAKCLDGNEIKDLIYKLARAEYIGYWFSYKTIEPLIKRLKAEEITSLKKEIFVEKKLDNKVQDWPYTTPTRPELKYYESNIFEDVQNAPICDDVCFDVERCCLLSAPSGCMMKRSLQLYNRMEPCRVKFETTLDKLFELYRFTSFEKTFSDLRKKMTVETLENRQSMMLVLVSKTGGRPESVDELMRLLLERHENEPVHIRATVIRSLVKRSCIWRLPQAQWDLCLKFAKDLGLDGKVPAAACNEGLHAVVLRNLLLDRECEPPIWEAFLKEFSCFKEYSLTAAERRVVATKLPMLLLSDAKSKPPEACTRLEQVLNTLEAYKISPDKCEGVISSIADVAGADKNADSLLWRLYKARVARKDLFKENFSIIQTDASYYNALKHDIGVLKSGEKFEALLNLGNLNHRRFLRALGTYFAEKDGLADKYLPLLQKQMNSSINVKKLPRSLAFISRNKLMSIINALDKSVDTEKRLAAALRANAHLARPLINLEAVGWDTFGAKAIANYVVTCSAVQADRLIERLLSGRRTKKLALVISMRTGKEYDTLSAVAKTNPNLAIKTLLRHQKLRKDLDPRVWDIIIPTIVKVKISDKNDKILNKAADCVEIVPQNKKADYCVAVFEACSKISKDPPMNLFRQIEKVLSDVDEAFMTKLIEDFIANKFVEEKLKSEKQRFNPNTYVRLIARFLLLCKSEASLQNRLALGKKFFDRLKEFWNKNNGKKISSAQQEDHDMNVFIDSFLLALKYSKLFLERDNPYQIQVFENVVCWMQNFLPIEEHFDKYSRLHLTMLYSKAIRQSVKNNPGIFKDVSNKMKEAVEIIGIIFGKYISHEVSLLKEKYFDSVIHLYKQEVTKYFDDYFEYDQLKDLFVGYVALGILEGKSEAHLVVEYMYNEKQYAMERSMQDKVLKKLKESQSKEVEFFLNANFYDNIY